jgi:hypothetical protein
MLSNSVKSLSPKGDRRTSSLPLPFVSSLGIQEKDQEREKIDNLSKKKKLKKNSIKKQISEYKFAK